ncbi:MAG: UDP-N-acetylmuramoyl-tripeptide--D-alanyl-D-alanine ligase [Candidatus Cardinium sp.]|uniref:UDP-N-acetylmuramoyl-tripeptide--D-alanyl-D- alanine ligase n=1 Tax=Cardinium endosymbiont of Dermatophagoides farinae TaxID=2597823 RepID=UPI0011905EFD|nr:UDP-N-acetylmuramoyl-tripeptide--D-alanyl-D-alanine ligase [Cardinium endosymbiont of Dermatophagoides farinae]TSJ81028.1 UDP-N-acetylmuramoyl-tripeptide--D-alanyl-D-alanine ligase [Cardinium endosymbiont of Dermatophagoides farinae]UWW97055.1 MAG: UDP-N-acetylmuramoyl-tripeptide--D-alanyl-D-alanine ligase [Candidatus Cardinium sp.]
MVAIEVLYKQYLTAGSVTTDTRQLAPGAIFFAIRGPHFNGNRFAAEALEKGASYVVIDDPAYAIPSSACILVKDSLTTLIQLAGYHRSQYNGPVIAITGSYGKTTTKELIYTVLQTTYKTVATKGNLNTPIGVALTLLSLQQDTQIAVVEMGATQPGDIALCCTIARPTHGMITAIGAAHLEGFGNITGVIQGKSELYDYLYATGGTVFLNSLDPLLSTISKRFAQLITYPGPNDFAPLELVGEEPYLRYKSSEGKEYTTHLLGKPHINNIAAALCVAKYFNIPAAHEAIQAYIPTNQRMQLMVKGSNQLIIDSYNASPASVQAALDALLQLKVRYRIVILGDMAELGNQTTAWHHKIVQQLCQPCYDQILLCGPFFSFADRKQPNILCFPTKSALENYLDSHTYQDSGILLKAANGMAIDTLVDQLE